MLCCNIQLKELIRSLFVLLLLGYSLGLKRSICYKQDILSSSMDGEERGTVNDDKGAFTPNPEIVQKLLALGATENAAIKACFYTGNFNADMAAAWLFENQDLDLDAPIEEDLFQEGSDDDGDDGDDLELYKMVFVVNTELNMGVGKIAAQVGHAAIALHRKMIDNPQKFGTMMLSWEQYGETKIVLKGDNAVQLNALAQQAESLGIPNYIVQDAGRTQIASGSQTVLGIIGKQDVVDSVTGKLKLM